MRTDRLRRGLDQLKVDHARTLDYWMSADFKGIRDVDPNDNNKGWDQITLALVAQTAHRFLPPDRTTLCGKIARDVLGKLLKTTTKGKGLPWDNVVKKKGLAAKSLGDDGPAFATGRILDDLGQVLRKLSAGKDPDEKTG